jgi:hypothetical protein
LSAADTGCNNVAPPAMASVNTVTTASKTRLQSSSRILLR